MERKDNAIITEDGQRLTVENGEITGTENTGAGLAFEGSPVQPGDENNATRPIQQADPGGGTCTVRNRDKEQRGQ